MGDTSVILPAHNESAVIERTLRQFEASVGVIVVANGCTDDTAERARAVGPHVKVIETPVGSKTGALNLGDAAAEGWPRFYVDADVLLSPQSLAKLVDRLERGDVLAVAPRARHDLAGCAWAVKAFYAVDSQLPSSREGIGGSGVYGLSKAGRERFGEFPKVTADDGFVRRQFAPHERATVADAWSVVRPPRTLAGLVKIKTRSHYGNYELDALYPELTRNRGQSNWPALAKLALRPWWWPKLAVYGYVKIVARRRAKRQWAGRGAYVWERDETSREAVGAGSVERGA